MNLTHKIIASHLVSGDLTPGAEIALRIDQTLTQDALGTLCYLQFEAVGVPRVRTKLSLWPHNGVRLSSVYGLGCRLDTA